MMGGGRRGDLEDLEASLVSYLMGFEALRGISDKAVGGEAWTAEAGSDAVDSVIARPRRGEENGQGKEEGPAISAEPASGDFKMMSAG